MKKISQIETGGRFLYGGVEWVKLYAGDGTVAISAEPVFERAFDEDNKNDWRSSSLRRELNGAFLDALVAEGADRAALGDLPGLPPGGHLPGFNGDCDNLLCHFGSSTSIRSAAAIITARPFLSSSSPCTSNPVLSGVLR